jgi:hypothetical protein
MAVPTRRVDPIVVDREFVTGLLELTAEEWRDCTGDYVFRAELDAACGRLVTQAYGDGDPVALRRLHDALAVIYDQDFGVTELAKVHCETQPILRDVAARLEQPVLAHELAQVDERQLRDYPADGRAFVHWLKRIIVEHPAGRHELYRSYLLKHATPADYRFFMAQETCLDPRFDDILALMQLGTSGQEKLELAGNYWDEMGNGNPDDVHTRMFAAALDALSIDDAYLSENLLLEARISSNLSAALALSRRHYLKSVGYFAVTEYLVPRRFKCMVAGWRRAGLPDAGIRYHDLHIGIDAVHASGWFKNVVAPLVQRDPATGREIAIGALIRLNSSQRYLDALLTRFTSAVPV